MSRAARCWQTPLLPYIDDPKWDRLRASIQQRFGRQYSLNFFDEQFARAQRGLLCYWLCSEHELQWFAKSRQLELQGLCGVLDTAPRSYAELGPLEPELKDGQPAFLELQEWEAAQGGYPRVSAVKLSYIKTLEQADDLKTFPRFPFLPAAVRARIYDLVMLPNAATDGMDAVPQPPITMTSRQIRVESLPLFYQNQKIGIQLEHHLPSLQSRNGGFVMNQRIARYLVSQARGDLMLIRRLTISGSLPVGQKGHPPKPCKECAYLLRCDINLDELMIDHQLVVGVESARGNDCGQLVNAVKGVLHSINSRIDGRIQSEDFFALKRVVEEAIFSGPRPVALQCCKACLVVRLGRN